MQKAPGPSSGPAIGPAPRRQETVCDGDGVGLGSGLGVVVVVLVFDWGFPGMKWNREKNKTKQI
jgi:hypothetical protein